MGFPMARNLLAAGFPLAVHNRTRAKAEPLDAGGAAVAASAAEAAERARIVITMLADDQAIETLAEAFALVEKAGLDRLAVLETLNGALFASPVYQTNGERMSRGAFSPPGFQLALGLKDIRRVPWAWRSRLDGGFGGGARSGRPRAGMGVLHVRPSQREVRRCRKRAGSI